MYRCPVCNGTFPMGQEFDKKDVLDVEHGFPVGLLCLNQLLYGQHNGKMLQQGLQKTLRTEHLKPKAAL